MQPFDDWLSTTHPKHSSLTTTVKDILGNLLHSERIDYLAIASRTKSLDEIREKIKRKQYKEPKTQLTDISGIRIILYFESDVLRVSELVERSFSVDRENSRNKNDLLAVNQIGYRSVHYVCDLGPLRSEIPEYNLFRNLRFEIQIRTVLQHAWAEISHDRNYKFSSTLPKSIERELFLYSGMLEIADKGFDKLAREIDDYASMVKEKTISGDLEISVDSVSLEKFVDAWSHETDFDLEEASDRLQSSELVEELKNFGITTLQQLSDIIPKGYAEAAKKANYSSNMFGLIRDWMLLHDWRHYRDVAWNQSWHGIDDNPNTIQLYTHIVGQDEFNQIVNCFGLWQREFSAYENKWEPDGTPPLP